MLNYILIVGMCLCQITFSVSERNALKGLAHAKIIKKSVILFWLLNMTI